MDLIIFVSLIVYMDVMGDISAIIDTVVMGVMVV